MLELHDAGDGHYGFDLTDELARFDGKLFGGAGLAAAVATLETATERRALWATVQFVGSADLGERIDCHAEVLAAGYNTTQARITATVGERLVFVALGSTARERDDGFSAELGSMPRIEPPDECASWMPDFPVALEAIKARGPFATADVRRGISEDGTPMLWARMKGMTQSRLTIAYLADFVPSSVLGAAGRKGGGTSLDNSIRFGKAPPVGMEWVLIDTDPHLADAGYVHGAARMWSEDGQLLAVASQTAVARLFD